MLKLKTHFEQVPVEIAKKIAEEQVQNEKMTEPAPRTKKIKLEEDFWGPKHGQWRGGNS